MALDKPCLKKDQLATFSNAELMCLLKCNHPEKIDSSLSDEKRKIAHEIMRQYTDAISFSKQKFIQALSATLTEVPSYLTVILCTFASVLSSSLGLLGLSICVGVFNVAAIAIGGFYFWSIYKELEANEKSNKNDVALNGLKLEAITEFTKRAKRKFDPINNILLVLGETTGLQDDLIHDMRTRRRVVESVVVVTTTLLSTYAITAITIFSLLGVGFFAAASTPLFGALILTTFLVSAAVGCFFGYKTFQISQQEKALDDYKNVLDADFLQKYEELTGLERGFLKSPDKRPPSPPPGDKPDDDYHVQLVSIEKGLQHPDIYRNSNTPHFFGVNRAGKMEETDPEAKNDLIGHMTALM